LKHTKDFNEYPKYIADSKYISIKYMTMPPPCTQETVKLKLWLKKAKQQSKESTKKSWAQKENDEFYSDIEGE